MERWWDGGGWSAMVRPIGGGTFGPPRRTRGARANALIAAATVVVLAGAGVGIFFAQNHGNPAPSSQPVSLPTGNQGGQGGGDGGGNGSGGLGGGNGNGGLGGGAPGASPSPRTTVKGGGGSTVADPINSLTIPVPSGWTGISGSQSGQGSWPALATGTYPCPSALAQQNGSNSTAASTCTRGGVDFTTTQGSNAKSTVQSEMATFAKDDYGTLTSHAVVSQGSISVAGRSGYQITWSVVPNYSGPSGTVQLIGLPDPNMPGYLALIDVGVDKSSQAPSLTSVDSQIIGNIVDSGSTGA